MPNGFAVGDLVSHVVRVWVTHVDTSDAFLDDQFELDFEIQGKIRQDTWNTAVHWGVQSFGPF